MGVVKWIVFSLGIFSFAIATIFSAMLMLQDPPAPKKAVKEKTAISKAEIKKVKSKKGKLSKNEKLVLEIAELRSALEEKNKIIDSLNTVASKAEQLEKELQKITQAKTSSKNKRARAKDMAKTLSSMKTKAMAPILNKLDDDTVVLIYKQTSKTARKDILLALSETRAAKITKKIINQK